MESKYRIQILDNTDRIVYFDRMKNSYGTHRVITSDTGGKVYDSLLSAGLDANLIRKYYGSECIVEVIKI